MLTTQFVDNIELADNAPVGGAGRDEFLPFDNTQYGTANAPDATVPIQLGTTYFGPTFADTARPMIDGPAVLLEETAQQRFDRIAAELAAKKLHEAQQLPPVKIVAPPDKPFPWALVAAALVVLAVVGSEGGTAA